MARTTARRHRHDLLGIYLNDHLAGATGGVGLARRMAAAADPGSEPARVLNTLVAEITRDRLALLTIMGTLEIPVRGYKMFAGWVGEKAGRVKLNGHLLTRSPLSELEETELMRPGVEGKAAGWRSLRSLAERDSRLDADQLDDLIERAKRQSDTLETLRVGIAERVLSAPAGRTS
jgi:hypothetical protein